MVTRRRYKDGGRVPPQESSASTDVMPPAPAPSVADDDAVLRAAKAAIRADDLQRAPTTVEEHIDRIPGLSDHKRQFLKSHTQFLTDDVQRQLLSRNYQEALRAGVTDDTAEMNDRVLSGVARDLDAMRQRQALAAASPPPEPSTPSPPHMPEPKRTLPIQAPVSREIPTSGGERYSSSRITLSPDEREIAQISYKHLPAEERDLAYARAKAKMIQLKAAGVIQGDG